MFLVLQSKHTLCYLIWTKEEKECWTSDVRNILFSLGIGYVWLQQGVGCETAFISLFKQRFTDIFKQQKDMYAKYRHFKSVFGSEKYFDFVDTKCFRDYSVKLRLGLLPLTSSTFNSWSPCDTTACCYYCNETETENI